MAQLPSIINNYLHTDPLPSHADPQARAQRKKFEKEHDLYDDKKSIAIYGVILVAIVSAGCYSLKSKAVKAGLATEHDEKRGGIASSRRTRSSGSRRPSEYSSGSGCSGSNGSGSGRVARDRRKRHPPSDPYTIDDDVEGDQRAWGDVGWYGRQKERDRRATAARWDGETTDIMRERERARRRLLRREDAAGRVMDVGGGAGA